MKRIWLLVPIVLAGCAHKEEAPPKPVVAVKMAKAELADLALSIKVPATIFPREQATIALLRPRHWYGSGSASNA